MSVIKHVCILSCGNGEGDFHHSGGGEYSPGSSDAMSCSSNDAIYEQEESAINRASLRHY